MGRRRKTKLLALWRAHNGDMLLVGVGFNTWFQRVYKTQHKFTNANLKQHALSLSAAANVGPAERLVGAANRERGGVHGNKG